MAINEQKSSEKDLTTINTDLLQNNKTPENATTTPENVTTEAKNITTTEVNPEILPNIVKNLTTTENTTLKIIESTIADLKNRDVKKLQKQKGVLKLKKAENINRKSLTGNFTNEEFAVIKKVIDYRISKGITTTYDNFIRQCIDFAMCHGIILKDFLKNLPSGNVGLFAIPDGQIILPMEKKGFFNK